MFGQKNLTPEKESSAMETKTNTGNIEDQIENGADIDNESEKYLTFFVNNQLYTIPSSQVIEIISMQTITYMPRLPEFVKGVINIRGKVIPLIELQLRLKKTSAAYDEHTCIIVVELGDTSVGFIVDRVHDVTDISISQISPAPKVSKTERQNDFLSGIAKLPDGIAMILDSQKVMDDSEKDASAKAKPIIN